MARDKMLLLLALSLLLSSAVPSALGACYSSSHVCNATSNRNVYMNDPQVPEKKAFPTGCTLPDFSCKCDTSAWKVGPWYMNTTSKAISQNYLSINQGRAPGNTKPYYFGVGSRAQCCQACTQGNAVMLDNGTIASYWPKNQARTKNGAYFSEGYESNGTKVFSCAYWQHFVPSPAKANLTGNCVANNLALSPDSCGHCIIFPSASTPPQCDGNSQTCNAFPDLGTWQSGNYSTVGKGCPGAKNDPHFVGARGTHFDFNGLPDQSFCLVTEERFQINMKMRGYLDTRTVGASVLREGKAVRTWIKELGVVWLDRSNARHTLRLWARDGRSRARDQGFLGGAELDGGVLPRVLVGETVSPGGLFTLSFMGYETQGKGFFDVDVYMLTIPGFASVEIKLRVAHPLLQTKDDAMAHINAKFLDLKVTEDVHGVLGQTFRPGRERRAVEFTALSRMLHRDISADSASGKGFLDGAARDYRTSSVTATDCKYSSFTSQRSAT